LGSPLRKKLKHHSKDPTEEWLSVKNEAFPKKNLCGADIGNKEETEGLSAKNLFGSPGNTREDQGKRGNARREASVG